MARYSYERLSAQDASFLWAEQPNQPMHVGAVAILEAGPLRRKGGGIDIARYRQAVDSVLHWIPRYRQKLAWIPVEGWPVWVDDRRFDLGYHIRHIALPKPGGLEQLKEMAARINARPLDRQRPLWEIWVIEGVEGGEQFAVLNKIHHCMIDGAAGADLSQILMSASARVEEREPLPYMPRPAPTPSELLRDSFGRSVTRPLGLLRDAAFGPSGEAGPGDAGIGPRLRALRDMLGYGLRPCSETPINGELGPHRRLDWLTMPLEDVRELRDVLGCTVNDVVLATVSGAMRRYLFRRRVDSRRIDFRVAAPVSTRRPEHDRRQGNHVSTWIVPLPVGVEDPIEQLSIVRERTRELKRSRADLAVDTLMRAAEWLPAALLAKGVGLANGPANMIVTNVQGPRFPLYMVGSRLLGLYPLVPLLPGGGLGIALFSYEDKLCWGFNGDYEIVPDLGALVDDVRVAFEQLRHATVTHFIERRTGAVEIPVEEGKPREDRATPSARRTRRPGRRKARSGLREAEVPPQPEVVQLEEDRPRTATRPG
jgi:WS/DGAT/MGAT family acyltransferase